MVGTVELVEQYDKPVVFVINAAVMRARLTGQAAVALSQYGTVAPVIVHHRVDFAAAMIDGRVVRELNRKITQRGRNYVIMEIRRTREYVR